MRINYLITMNRMLLINYKKLFMKESSEGENRSRYNKNWFCPVLNLKKNLK